MIEARSEKLWDLLDRNAEFRRVVTGFGFTEGPVVSRRGFLLFSDIPNEKILKWENGELSVYREKSNKANGLTFDHQGRLLTAEGGARVTRTEKNGAVTVLAQDGLVAPNDLVYGIDGSLYFTDLRGNRVYQITRERSGVGGAPPKGAVRVVLDTPGPNGIALSPNQQQLYVAATGQNVVRRYSILDDGRLAEGTDFAPLRVDGLKTDENGNVWMASGDGIFIYNAAGEHVGTLRPPERPSNCCFGEGFRGLYVTAQKSVYYMPTKTNGTRTF